MAFLVGWSTLFAVLLTVTMMVPFLAWRCRSLPVPPAPVPLCAPTTLQPTQPYKNMPTGSQPIPVPSPQPPRTTPPLAVAPAATVAVPPLPSMPLPRGPIAIDFALQDCTSMQEALDRYAAFHAHALQQAATHGCQYARYLLQTLVYRVYTLRIGHSLVCVPCLLMHTSPNIGRSTLMG